jgi:hypothetical protein
MRWHTLATWSSWCNPWSNRILRSVECRESQSDAGSHDKKNACFNISSMKICWSLVGRAQPSIQGWTRLWTPWQGHIGGYSGPRGWLAAAGRCWVAWADTQRHQPSIAQLFQLCSYSPVLTMETYGHCLGQRDEMSHGHDNWTQHVMDVSNLSKASVQHR